MTKVTYKERRFTSAFVEECKEQEAGPHCPAAGGYVIACPESRRPKKKKARGQTPHFAHVDPVAYLADERTPKRVTQNQLRGLNANAVHIDDDGFLKEGPKKVKGFDQLRDLFGKG